MPNADEFSPFDAQAVSTETAQGLNPSRGHGAIGHFRINRIIAQGGMGTVYEAMQENPKRIVAVKVLKPGITSHSAMRRFEYETQVLARLRHPGIAQIYEAGMHSVYIAGHEPEMPIPYFAMEYIPDAKPLTQYAEAKHLGTRQRLSLFIPVCDAVHHGHQKGIIHRDLKPGNILVDATGQVKVIDFGIARSTDSDVGLTTARTDVGQLIGTLQYMSPEQCGADAHDIDMRSDVYSLGIVLYELLCGHFPYALADTPFQRAPQVICETPPLPISIWNRTLRGDIATILSKALEKDPDRRYQSTDALAKDIDRYLRNEPILARPPSAVYRLSKFIRRRRVPVSLIIAVGIAAFLAMNRHSAALRATGEADHQRAYHAYFDAVKAADRGESASAIEACDRAVALDSTLAAAYALRGKLRTRQRDMAGALLDCNRALELDEGNSLAARTRGYLLLVRGDFEAAESAYDRGIGAGVSSHDLPEDFHSRARIHQHFGRYPQAIADFNRAIALEPKAHLPHIGRGITKRFVGDIDGAIEDFDHAGVVNPIFIPQCKLWVWELRMMRNSPGDREAANEALGVAMNAAVTKGDKTAIAVVMGELTPEQASVTLESSNERMALNYYIGVRYQLDGRPDEARACFQRCLASGTNDMPESVMARWQLRNKS